jgi:hypothetical protein
MFILNKLNHDNNEIGWKNYLNLYIKFIHMNVIYVQNFA